MKITLKNRRKTEEDAGLTDAVYETVLEAILSGRLTAGTIVSEVALAAQLEVSRTPVHDALRQLAKDGLVRQRKNRRAVVSTFARDDVHDIFEMRKLLEGESARRAATRIDRLTLARLRETADALAATRDDPRWVARWADFDRDFHTSIAAASGSPRLASDIGRYQLLHYAINKISTNVSVLQRALLEHRSILDALDRRDGRAAARAMVEHIAEWQTYFVNCLPD